MWGLRVGFWLLVFEGRWDIRVFDNVDFDFLVGLLVFVIKGF